MNDSEGSQEAVASFVRTVSFTRAPCAVEVSAPSHYHPGLRDNGCYSPLPRFKCVTWRARLEPYGE